MKKLIKIFDTNCEHYGLKNSLSSFPGFTFEPSLVEMTRNPNDKTEISFFTDNCLSYSDNDDSKEKYAILLEPRVLVPSVYNDILRYENNFKLIFTHDEQLLKLGGKYVPYLFGGLWAKPSDKEKYQAIKKRRKMCIIASGKNQLRGHIFRHQIISTFSRKYQIDVFGNGYRYVENIGDVFCNYDYAIVVENVSDGYWITEKAITPLFCGAKILYYGSNNINKFFPSELNKEGEIIFPFNSIEELETLILKCYDSDRKDISNVADWILENNMNCIEDWIYKNYLK